MSKITKITVGKSRQKRVNIFLDGKFSFSLLAEVALKEGLKVGQELSTDQEASLTDSDYYSRCYNAAIQYLGYRPRSEAEIRQRLQRHGFNNDSMDKVLGKLRDQGLADDTVFARFWKDNRESFSPRSKWLTRLELQRKGLDIGIIEQVVDEVDDSDSAYRAALRQARRLSPSDQQIFSRRLSEHLRRRGFSYEIINDTVQRVWKEHANNPG
ncbi:regulatory protein RecX [Chloroflexota bacterium]